ncbi:MAG: hypothetical protein FWC41_07075, partial [Firmicutes bacterium]|nr:hypothetical protein [Bacillota bacterium]
MAELKTDFNETQKALALLKQDHGNSLVEVRLFKGKYVKSGYFKDYNNLLKSLSTLDYDNCYITLNTINDACYARTQKETMKANCKATSDHDIINRDWLLIDADP